LLAQAIYLPGPFNVLPISGKLRYKYGMKQQPLSKTNTYLRDTEKRRRALLRSVLSSSAVEGIQLTAEDVERAQSKAGPVTPRSGSGR
jgi:hypothetical protein